MGRRRRYRDYDDDDDYDDDVDGGNGYGDAFFSELIALAWERPGIGAIWAIIVICVGIACGFLMQSRDVVWKLFWLVFCSFFVIVGSAGLLVSGIGLLRDAISGGSESGSRM
jgi:hypothetical protein